MLSFIYGLDQSNLFPKLSSFSLPSVFCEQQCPPQMNVFVCVVLVFIAQSGTGCHWVIME